MINSVTTLLPASVAGSGNGNQTTTGQSSGDQSFSNVLGNLINKVGDMEIESSKLSQQMAAGQGTDIHTVMIAGEKASLALQLTTQVRNRAVEAYQEIMRMPL